MLKSVAIKKIKKKNTSYKFRNKEGNELVIIPIMDPKKSFGSEYVYFVEKNKGEDIMLTGEVLEADMEPENIKPSQIVYVEVKKGKNLIEKRQKRRNKE